VQYTRASALLGICIVGYMYILTLTRGLPHNTCIFAIIREVKYRYGVNDKVVWIRCFIRPIIKSSVRQFDFEIAFEERLPWLGHCY
jgi:hypothetical protein